MNKLTTNREIRTLTLLFAATYMISYMTRINYGAVISEMETATGFSRSLLSMAVTGSFVTYGVGQIVSGVLGDRFSPKKLISLGLCITVLMNLLIPLCQSPYQMLCVWCVNGFAQSLMWPPMVRLMTALLHEDDYKKAAAQVLWGGNIGTILMYLLSPVLISAFGWRSVFLFSAICGLIMLFIWNKHSYELAPAGKQTNARSENAKSPSLFTPLMAGISAAIILQGMLRDGITTWMPTYISETYHFSNAVSILTGVVLPLFSILCLQLAIRLYRKRFTNPLTCAGVFFGIGALAALGLFLSTGHSAGSSVLLSAMLTGCMHGAHLMLTGMLPLSFEKYGNVSTVSGVLNACTYIGSAASTYGIALISETASWHVTLLLWLLIALCGTAICLLCTRPWKRKFEN